MVDKPVFYIFISKVQNEQGILSLEGIAIRIMKI